MERLVYTIGATVAPEQSDSAAASPPLSAAVDAELLLIKLSS
jgi:hypothetical protein